MAVDPKQTLKELEEGIKSLQEETFKFTSIFGILDNEIKKSVSSTQDLVNNFKKGKDISNALAKEQAKVQEKALYSKAVGINLEKQISEALANNLDKEAKLLNKKLTKNKAQQKLIEYTLGELDALEKITNEEIKQNSLQEKVKETYKSLEKSLSNQIGFSFTLSGIFTAIIQSAFKIDAQVVELSKSLGVTKGQAKEISNEFASYARSVGDGFTNLNNLTQAQSDLTKQLGVAVRYTNEEVGMFAKLTGLYGLTTDEASKLTRYSTSHGKNIKEYTGDLLVASKLTQIETGTRFDQREILQDISKLSAGILVKFQDNPKALAQAVVEAKKLGINLETVDKIGESLLNFESSIENELKAELLTGKQINLEKARYAALTGNQLDLTREITSQVGTLNDFENMNVIAQKSLAEAFGLSRDEMSEMLLKQQAINNYGDKAAKLNAQELKDLEKSGKSLEEYLTDQQTQVDIQNQFNNAIVQLQTMLGQIADGPLMNLISGFASLLSSAGGLYTMIGLIGGVALTKMIIGLTTSIALQRISANLSRQKAGSDIVSAGAVAAASAAAIPGIGWLIAGGVAAALIGGLVGYMAGAGKADDMISEGGYGKRTLLSPEGAIKLNDNDTIIAGTNLGGGNGGNVNNTSIDLTPMVTIMSEVKSAIDKLYSKNTNISLDSKDLGNGLVQGSYKFA